MKSGNPSSPMGYQSQPLHCAVPQTGTSTCMAIYVTALGKGAVVEMNAERNCFSLGDSPDPEFMI